MSASVLKARIADLEKELDAAKALLRVYESPCEPMPPSSEEDVCALSQEEIHQYSRQIIVPGFGAATQEVLRSLAVLVVGAGGLGCPVSLYLAAAGVGRLGIADDDVVETSNLHRQIGHSQTRVGWSKAASLAAAAAALNVHVHCTAHESRFDEGTAAALVTGYDIVVDATDNPASRYLINDAAVLAGKPVVFGAALGCDGQVSVYHYRGGPCYRCIHPSPPPSSTVTSCADYGVLGPVTGVVGSLQALEVLKIASEMAAATSPPQRGVADRAKPSEGSAATVCGARCSRVAGSVSSGIGASLSGRLLVFDGAEARVRVVKLRGRRADCAVCSCACDFVEAGSETLRIQSVRDSAAWLAAHGMRPFEAAAPKSGRESAPRERLTGAPCVYGTCTPQTPLTSDVASVSVSTAACARAASACVFVDVRSREQFSVCALRGSVNIPLDEIKRDPVAAAASVRGLPARFSASGAVVGAEVPMAIHVGSATVYVICRRGVDSAEASQILAEHGVPAVANVAGGLLAWSSAVDPRFPTY